jgi:hypothetical protein
VFGVGVFVPVRVHLCDVCECMYGVYVYVCVCMCEYVYVSVSLWLCIAAVQLQRGLQLRSWVLKQ